MGRITNAMMGATHAQMESENRQKAAKPGTMYESRYFAPDSEGGAAFRFSGRRAVFMGTSPEWWKAFTRENLYRTFVT
jgi:hypothetical protein